MKNLLLLAVAGWFCAYPAFADTSVMGINPSVSPIVSGPDKDTIVNQSEILSLQQRFSKAMQVADTITEVFKRQQIVSLIENYREALGRSDTRRMAEVLRQIERLLGIKNAPNQKPPKNTEGNLYNRRPGFSFGMINTNFDNTKGVVSGGMDGDRRIKPSETRADQNLYPNNITDPVEIRREHPAWKNLILAFNQILGRGISINPLIPFPGFETGLIKDPISMNLIANQVFVRASSPENPEQKIAVTWVLPPNWSPEQSHAVLMIFPPIGQSNNGTLFSDPQLKTFVVMIEALKTSQSKHLALMIVNSGGITASGIQPDIEYPLLAALEYGAARLGLDPARMAMMGEGRGGYAAMSMAGRLKAIAPQDFNLNWRGIFVGEAGTVSEEMAAPPTLAPFDIFNRLGETTNDTIGRLIGFSSIEAVVAKGPLGSLARLKPTMPMVFYWGGNLWNPSLLPSSLAKIMKIVQAIPQTQSQFVVDRGDKIDSLANDRYRLAVDCLVALSDRRDCQLSATGLHFAGGNGFQMPVLLRAPAWVLVNQPSAVEIMGPAGEKVGVAVTGATNYRRILPSQLIPEQGVLRIDLPPSTSNGNMTIELIHADQSRVGMVKIPIVSSLPNPNSPTLAVEKWIPPIMPHIVDSAQ